MPSKEIILSAMKLACCHVHNHRPIKNATRDLIAAATSGRHRVQQPYTALALQSKHRSINCSPVNAVLLSWLFSPSPDYLSSERGFNFTPSHATINTAPQSTTYCSCLTNNTRFGGAFATPNWQSCHQKTKDEQNSFGNGLKLVLFIQASTVTTIPMTVSAIVRSRWEDLFTKI